MQDQKLSEIEEKVEQEKKIVEEVRTSTRKSLANLCEFLETYEEELDAETESKAGEQEAAVAVEPALS